MTAKKRPKSDLAKSAGRALKRAAKRARIVARQYGTRIHVQAKGEVLALEPRAFSDLNGKHWKAAGKVRAGPGTAFLAP